MVHGSMVDLTLIKAYWSCFGLLLDFAHTFGTKTINLRFAWHLEPCPLDILCNLESGGVAAVWGRLCKLVGMVGMVALEGHLFFLESNLKIPLFCGGGSRTTV